MKRLYNITQVSGAISAEQDKVALVLLANAILLAHSNIHLKQVAIKKIIDRVINGVRLDRYLPFTEMISSYQQSLSPSIEILPEGNLKFDKLIKREELFTQYYLNVKRNPSKTPASRRTQGVYCCEGH